MKQEELTEFTYYYNRYKQQLFNYALKLSGDRMRTEDLVQTVFLRFYENLPNLKHTDRAQYWLFKTMRNEIYSIFRAKKVRVDQFGAADIEDISVANPESIELQYELQNLKEILLAQLEMLPVEQRDVLLLREYGGFSYREIAAMLQIDEDLVKGRLNKARTKLIKKMSRMIE